jgi:ferredoxin-type protein NapH
MSRDRGAIRWSAWRRATQAAVALLYLALPPLGIGWLAGTLSSLKLGPLDLVEPAGALSAALAGRRAGWAMVLGAAPLLALAAWLGPVFCSWACPFGLVSEGLDRLRFRRRPWAGRPWEAARRVRLGALLGFLAGSLLLGSPLAALLSPPRLVTALPLEAWVLRGLPVATAGLLLAFLVLELLGPRRLTCRALCPAGALAALLRNRRSWGPRLDRERCRCPETPPCQTACPWGIDPRLSPGLDGCTSCMRCVERCPSEALTALRRG